MKRWTKRSDLVILAMVILWFAVAAFAAVIVVIQTMRESYYNNLGDLLMFVGGPMTAGIIGWLIKNAVENSTKSKLNPDYLKIEGEDKIL